MELIINFDAIVDADKKDWLLRSLKLMGISYHTAEGPQTLEEYNRDLEDGSAEIERGHFTTNEQLKREVTLW